ncbi:MAG: SHOCT domain-containing protein [Bacteroidaceae bacterium]|nr:SHOCT domain-containing protein [Bacteroidaceae bacterium]
METTNEQKGRNLGRVLRGALIGWLLFTLPIAVSCGRDMGIFLDPHLWIMSIPGALFGAIAGILMNNKEKRGTPVVINEESFESKIKGLKNLLDEGLLTQEEFDEQKKKILNS